MEHQLPENASLEHLRSQAKDLLSHLRKDDPSIKLHEAQLRLARDYGFHSWPKLVGHVEALAASQLTRSEAIAAAEQGIREGQPAKRARALLAGDPSLRAASPPIAIMCFDKGFPIPADAVGAPVGALKTPPIVYAAFSPFARERPDDYASMIGRLLELGADPNTAWQSPDWAHNPLPVLYAAAGVARNPAATKLFLDAGARVDDTESLYHSTESRDHSCLKLLLDAHPQNDHHYALLRMLDFEDMDGLILMLEAGCDPNKHLALAHAIRRGRSVAILRRLIEAGAKTIVPDHGGLTIQKMVYERGIDLPEAMPGFVPDNQDELLRACWTGDAARAAALSGALSGLSPLRRKAFTDAMWAGRAETVDAFLAAGFTWQDRDDSKGTPLHCACFRGSKATVEALLKHNPPMDDHEDMYDAIPIQWAMHSSESNSDEPDRDFVGVVRAMAEAGSPSPHAVSGHPDVRAVLVEFWPDLPTQDFD